MVCVRVFVVWEGMPFSCVCVCHVLPAWSLRLHNNLVPQSCFLVLFLKTVPQFCSSVLFLNPVPQSPSSSLFLSDLFWLCTDTEIQICRYGSEASHETCLLLVTVADHGQPFCYCCNYRHICYAGTHPGGPAPETITFVLHFSSGASADRDRERKPAAKWMRNLGLAIKKGLPQPN